MKMTYDTFIDSIRRQTGLESAAEAEQMVASVLRVWGEVLVSSDREALAAQLPPSIREPLSSRHADQDFGLEEFYQRIGQEEHVNEGRAKESAQVVAQTLMRAVDGEIATRIRRRLPSEFEEILVDPHANLENTDASLDAAARANERTLARGEPGSREPVSESPPPKGQTDSIAANENPYGDTKIATGRESTDEEENTLAGGKPGSERPLSDTHEE